MRTEENNLKDGAEIQKPLKKKEANFKNILDEARSKAKTTKKNGGWPLG